MATTLSARRHYRKQVRSSACRGKVKNTCRKSPSCRLTKSGARKSYCRKRRISRRHSGHNLRRKRTRSQRAKSNMFENLGSSS
jgi:hypothetical protein